MCAGRLPNKQSHVLFKKQAHPVKRIHFTDVKPLRQFLMIFQRFLFKRISKMGSKVRSQPLQSKEIKISSTVLIHKICQRAIKPPKDFYQIFKPSTFVQWAGCPPGTQPGQRNTRILIFTFFCNKGNSMFFGLKLANSPQTGTQAKESKSSLKSQ